MITRPYSYIKYIYPTLIALSLLLLTSCANASGNNTISDSAFYFDTVIQVTLYDKKEQYALDHCMELAERYEHLFSATIPDSDISKINANCGTFVTVSDETLELVQYGIDYSKLSDGRFDITMGELSSLWDYDVDDTGDSDSNASHIPKNSDIKSALLGVDYNNIQIDGNSICLNSDNAAIDLGGIAKGYIADKIKAYLKSENITSGLINLGGNVLTIDTKPDGSSYTIGIQKPFSDDGTPIVSVDIIDKSVVTSGIYQRYFEEDGHIYHHIIDLDTGYPCDNELSSVTIIGDSSTQCDALSTSVFLLGLEAGMDFVESYDNIEAIFITRENELEYSSGMGDLIPYHEYEQ